MNNYPNTPGYKAEGPSQEAAQTIAPTAKSLRAAVLRTMIQTSHGLTADQIATELSRSILSIRPRVAELHRQGVIRPTGERRKNESGLSATVWTICQGAQHEIR